MKESLVTSRIQPVRDGAFVHLFRRGKKVTKVRLGPNHVHAFITRKDGTIVDLGISKNLLTNGYSIIPTCTPRFMGLTTDAAAAAAGDTVLATEITTGGCARTKATYAHTGATATYTMQVVFSVTSTFTAIHKMGLFTAKDTTSAGIMVFETVLNQDATVGNGDTLTVTDTVTLSG